MTSLSPLNQGWSFRVLSHGGSAPEWTIVDLPHTPFVAGLDGEKHWFGECEYQRTVSRPADAPPGPCAIYIGAAMHTAIVSLDGAEWTRHSGGYLPFEIDLANQLSDGREHTITVKIDNCDNPDVPPGKPFADLDFCWYGGLYRRAELRCYPSVHITDPVGAASVAAGGVFVRTLSASPSSATVSVNTHIRNTSLTSHSLRLEVEVVDGLRVVSQAEHHEFVIAPQTSQSIEVQLEIPEPRLWQPNSPSLYHARASVISANQVQVDQRKVRFGIRRIAFSRSGGFTINGSKPRLRGTNRHQEHPYVGYAVPAAAQRRDARRIKESGFDYVRLSHYPQSSDFLDACDELGILVMNCIPGWQFVGGPRFRDACCQNARDLIRRDRNHPCVVLWELALNETDMDAAFMARLHAIGHEEYPGDQMFTCGWLDHYDVFIHSRQHGKILTWQNENKALVIAEYGDWEFYASNEGFDQKTGAGVFASWSNSRKLRGHGERGLRQQAFNHQIGLNETLSSQAVFAGQWSMFDYPRGYDPSRATCGVMDIFRLPKFSYHLYRSQRDPEEAGEGWTVGAVVFIASHWTPGSDLRVLVFSNCDEVELRLNDSVIARQRPARTTFSQFLPHPPFVFDLPCFSPGTLKAVGFIKNLSASSHVVATPGTVAQLTLSVDDMAVGASSSDLDVLIAHAFLRDGQGTLCIDETLDVQFAVSGRVELVGPPTSKAEAGIASVVLRVPAGSLRFEVDATTVCDGQTLLARLKWEKKSNALMAPLPSNTMVTVR